MRFRLISFFIIICSSCGLAQVGIGTNSPSLLSGSSGLNIVNSGYTQLRVQSTQSSAGIEFSPGVGNNWEIQASPSKQFFVYDRTQSKYRFLIDEFGYVGVGTTTPEALLDIRGAAIIGEKAGASFYNSNAILHLRKEDKPHLVIEDGHQNTTGIAVDASSFVSAVQVGDFIWRTGVTYNGDFTSTGSERMRITTNGNVGIGTSTPEASALLELSSNTKGFLPPRLTTTERDLISTPVNGLVIYNTTKNGLEVKTNTGWISLVKSTAVALPTVVIGQQQWMAENLNVAFYSNGDSIPEVTDANIWKNLTTGAWCYYNNDPANGEIYGKIYNAYAIADSRGLCPSGWHVPTYEEFQTLSASLGGDALAGGKMKKPGLTYWNSPNANARNTSGFTGLPGGTRIGIDGRFDQLNKLGFFWTRSTSNGSYKYTYLNLNFGDFFIGDFFAAPPSYGYSVRCIRD
jgi:uncharacterized protein (TIGR02145 family)